MVLSGPIRKASIEVVWLETYFLLLLLGLSSVPDQKITIVKETLRPA